MKANAIQFGLDQLLEAPTPKLIAFIHWYYWALNVGSSAFFYFTAANAILLHELDVYTNGTLNQMSNGNLTGVLYLLLYCAMAVVATAVFLILCFEKKRFYIQKAGLNPFMKMYKVLKYSWKHKVPEHRSAFTYWEEDIPRRIDLGKNKYGGPFTNEGASYHSCCVCLDTILQEMATQLQNSSRSPAVLHYQYFY